MSTELIGAFTDSQVVSYCKLKTAKWTGEAVDVYANKIRKQARGCGFVDEGLEQIVKLAFITGFPDSIAVELQQVQGIEKLNVSDIIGRARVLAANAGAGNVAAPGFNQAGGRQPLECFNCRGPHMVRNCPHPDKRKTEPVKCHNCGGNHKVKFCREEDKSTSREGAKGSGTCSYGSALKTVSSRMSRVPIIEVTVNAMPARALVDTGCTSTMVTEQFVNNVRGKRVMAAFDGREVVCKGSATVNMSVGSEKFQQEVTVVEKIVGEIDMVLGMDTISRLGGVKVEKSQVQFGTVCAVACVDQRSPDIEDKDFEAFFDGESWEVRYFWNQNGAPSLKNTVAAYDKVLTAEKQKEYDAEIDRWIEEGILVPWNGEVSGIIPLMAVEQATKNKIRPVLDFRELNENVSCHTGDDMTDVCCERLREWRRMEGEGQLVDLKAAYLQIRVAKELWKYQLVRVKGKVFCLTRLGFGLNSAPRIMTKILKTVLMKNEEVKDAASSFIDDIMVNESKVDAGKVIEHLNAYGLKAKEPEELDGGAALGLKLKRAGDGQLHFTRANEIPDVSSTLTRRELFSVCGKLVGHYPRAGWLRVACSYVKRHASGAAWTDYVGDATRDKLSEIVKEVQKSDPVKGKWGVPLSCAGVVWCDASDLALGVVVEIGGVIVEDSSWLRKKDDYNHINVAELEAVLKGINLCSSWDLKDITVMTDSATVCSWIKLTLSEEKKVKTKGAAEILVKRRLGILKSLIEELGLSVNVKLVKSGENKADELTRIRKQWLTSDEVAGAALEDVERLHTDHHMGVERTWYLAKKIDGTVDKETVKKVVRQCQQCQSIDPAPTVHCPGELGVKKNWSRLAIDVTHYRGIPYLTMVDCGPGRHAIWRELRGESASEICREIDGLFYERGPVDELLMDNARAFRSDEMRQLLGKWGVASYFRAAYRASGNGIVERSHRTIKAMAERTGGSPIEAVYFYNIAPRNRQNPETVPQRSLFTYEWRLPGQSTGSTRVSQQEGGQKIKVGDEVWVKPGNARCTAHWERGEVTNINSANNVEVDGIPRHILDIRQVVELDQVSSSEDEMTEEGRHEPRYPQRDRRGPSYLEDYDLT